MIVNFKWLMAFIIFVVSLWAAEPAIDQRDSLTIRSILDQIGWHDVEVNSVAFSNTGSTSSRIAALNLSHKSDLPKIRNLPSIIGKLTELQNLNLSGNGLTTLPSEISILLKLSHLNCSINEFTKIPDHVVNLSALQHFDFSRNMICCLPGSISKLNQLTILNCNNNAISAIPAEITQLHALRTIMLGSNKIDALPDEIAMLKSLEFLQLDSNFITQLPLKITELTQVKVNVNCNQLCTFSDQKVVNWINSHSIGSEWKASQRCASKGFSDIVTDLVNGVVVVFNSDYNPDRDIVSPVTIQQITADRITAGDSLYKSVRVTVDPLFQNKTNTCQITFKLDSLDSLSFKYASVYYNTPSQWEYLGGAKNYYKRTITVQTSRTGEFAVVIPRNRITAISLYNKPRGQNNSIVLAGNGIRISILSKTALPSELVLVSPNGRIVLRRSLIVKPGNNVFDVNCSGIRKGFYMVDVQGQGHSLTSKLFIY